jgi:hypothetical protein
MDVEGVRCEGVDWIPLTQNKIQWRTLLITMMNLQVQQKLEILLRG